MLDYYRKEKMKYIKARYKHETSELMENGVKFLEDNPKNVSVCFKIKDLLSVATVCWVLKSVLSSFHLMGVNECRAVTQPDLFQKKQSGPLWPGIWHEW